MPSPEDELVLTGLRDIRLPEAAMAESLAMALIAFALAFALMVAIAAAMRLAGAAPRRKSPPLAETLATIEALPPGEKLAALARLAQEAPQAGTVRAEIAQALYRPVDAARADALHKALAAALAR